MTTIFDPTVFDQSPFDQIIDRRHTASLKWEKYSGTDIMPMWVADMDFKAPQPVLDALKKKIRHGIFGYTTVPETLNETIVQRMESLYHWQIQKNWIIWIPGVVSALNVACSSFGRSDKRIATTTPIYPPFLSAPSNTGNQLITVAMKDVDHRASLDFEKLEDAFKQGVSLFMFCSPYNPCGTVFTKKELQTLVDLCEKYDVIICSDEIHCDFVLDKTKRHIPTAAVSQKTAQKTVTLMAPSKTYNIPGLGCSFAIIPNDGLRKSFISNMAGLVPHVNALGFFAAQAAYEKCDPWLAELIVYLGQNRDMVFQQVNQMSGLKLNPIESTYLAWIDARAANLPDPVKFFEDAGVGLSDGKFFGQPGFVRLNFGCPRSIIEKALNKMRTALERR